LIEKQREIDRGVKIMTVVRSGNVLVSKHVSVALDALHMPRQRNTFFKI